MRKWLSVLFAFIIAMLIIVPDVTGQSNKIAGGWSSFSSEISPQAVEVFEAATNGLTGVNYEPVAVSTQLVSGTNYSFFCNAKVVYPNSPNEAALIQIYQPLEGAPRIIEISKIEH
ncbi:MAG: hypothetical protein AAGG02_13985 [Cyanobacteria bacterium P01_H01_bin.15]